MSYDEDLRLFLLVSNAVHSLIPQDRIRSTYDMMGNEKEDNRIYLWNETCLETYSCKLLLIVMGGDR
jgi:hypothetical protein